MAPIVNTANKSVIHIEVFSTHSDIGLVL